jgi:uncharacterized protein YndB with AHSA1/START domain
VREERTDEIFTVRAVHSAPRALVFAVMTTPEHLSQFWGPIGTHTPVAGIVIDLRPGGVFETTMVNDNSGDEHTMRAVYVEIREPEYLSWREVGTGMVTELRFIDRGQGSTEVITTQRGVPPAMRSGEARAGWRSALNRNAAYLAWLVAESTGEPEPASRPPTL